MMALGILVDRALEEHSYKLYVADCLWLLATEQRMKPEALRPYSEILDGAKAPPKDESATEILEGIKAKLRERIGMKDGAV
jgi:hypothetical protein